MGLTGTQEERAQGGVLHFRAAGKGGVVEPTVALGNQ